MILELIQKYSFVIIGLIIVVIFGAIIAHSPKSSSTSGSKNGK